MDVELIERVVPELRESLTGLSLRSVFQLGPERLALAFEGEEFHLLFIGIQPLDPRIHLIRRRLRDLKKRSTHPSQFAIALEKTLAGTRVSGLDQVGEDRVIEIRFSERNLIVQLTGKSSNLFLVDSKGLIAAAMRRPVATGQTIGSVFKAPEPPKRDQITPDTFPPISNTTTISEALDEHFQSIDDSREFDALAAAAKHKNRQELAKMNRLVKNLNSDLAEHGDAEKWKRYGDLLLANQSGAERNGTIVRVVDLFDESAPVIEIEADANDSIPEAAQKYFRRYAKARNARTAIESRLKDIQVELQQLDKHREAIEKAITDQDEEFLREFVGKKGSETQKTRRDAPSIPSRIRTFISSDGFEILVEKKRQIMTS